MSTEEHPDVNAASGPNDTSIAVTRTMGPAESAETVIGRYRLLQKIGEGGMGEVWLAEQKDPVRRRVAIKLIKAGMDTREVVVRFESERQALALMDHPAIAKVFDAGSTPQGAPYFVMEYVAGVPITTYCDHHRLSTRDRLDLFMRVCEGVQHAHQKAIIHRDLKPSNILVIEVDGRPAPKIIDFGVAKALTQKLTADTMFTRVGALVGTPEYMSPEQALSIGEDIDTRTDVYSLGITFYELLAGAPPIELRKIALEEFLRRLREDDPPKPSTRLRTQDPATLTEVARKRQSEPLALARQFSGDLDSIALKALEKDRSRRYGSPSDFAADIARYLKNEPVLAVPPSVAYRFRKFARRYRGALATGCAFALVLIVATVISVRQSIRANREAATAQAVNDFLQNDVLAQASAATQSGSSATPDPDLKVRTALDRAAARIAGKFGRQPEVEASIRDTMGQTYMDLGLYPEAQKQLEQALDSYRRVLGAENPRTLKTTTNLGRVLFFQGKHADAERLLQQNLETERRVLGPEDADTLKCMSTLGVAYSMLGKYAQAEALTSQTLEIRRRVLGAEHRDTLSSMNNLAAIYSNEGKDAQASQLFEETFEIRRRVLGAEHPDTLRSMMRVGMAYESEGKYQQAEAVYKESLDIQRRVLGAEHDSTLFSMSSLAGVYHKRGQYPQAEALRRQVLEIQRRILGAENPATISTLEELAESYWIQGKYAQAEELLNQALPLRRRVMGPHHLATASTLASFAAMYQRQGKYALAQTYAAQALAVGRQAVGSERTITMGFADDLALAYLSQGKFDESERLAREAVAFFRKSQPDDWERFRAESLLGAGLTGQKKYVEAEPLLLEGHQGMEARKDRTGVPDWYHLDRARDWIVQLYQAWGKPEKAAEWKKK